MSKAMPVISADDSLLEVSFDGGVTWLEMPFLNAFSSSGGTAEEREVRSFRNVTKIAGREALGSLSVGIASAMDHIFQWRKLRADIQAGKTPLWRYTTKGALVVKGNGTVTAAIAKTGAVTFAAGNAEDRPDPSDAKFGIGQALVLPNDAAQKIFSVDRFVGDPPVIYVSDPSLDGGADRMAVVTADVKWSLVVPTLRYGGDSGFLARASGLADFDQALDGNLTKTITLTPTAVVIPTMVANSKDYS